MCLKIHFEIFALTYCALLPPGITDVIYSKFLPLASEFYQTETCPYLNFANNAVDDSKAVIVLHKISSPTMSDVFFKSFAKVYLFKL